MPERYYAIKRSLREQHPGWSEEHLEKVAAKIFNSTLQSGEKAVGGHHKHHTKDKKSKS